MKIKLQIKSVVGKVLFEFEKENNTIEDTLEEAIRRSANLRSADLSYADLSSANLSFADLSSADLSSANLRSANLSSANLRSANLRSANLRSADLSSANLSFADLSSADLSSADLSSAVSSCANLRSANLRSANLRSANLRSADLRSANLRFANLRFADLRSANLSYADLSSANANEGTAMFFSQCPTEGSFIAWKKCQGKIVKLEVTEDAKRSSATTLKSRCSKAKVLDIQEKDGNSSGLSEIVSSYDNLFIYRIGEIVEVLDFDTDRWNECSTGIHIFIDRDMAVRYN